MFIITNLSRAIKEVLPKLKVTGEAIRVHIQHSYPVLKTVFIHKTNHK